MIKKWSKIILCVGIFAFACSVYPQFVYAERIGIAVDQMSIAFDADAGEKQEFVINVTNVSDKKQEVYVGAIDYVVGENNDLELDREFDEHDGVKDWITVENSNITLEPNQVQEVKFVFTAPDSAPVGSHRGAVVFRVKPDDSGDVSVQGQIAVHTLVNIKGDTHASGRVNSFDVPLLAIGKIDYAAEFENTGNIHYVPYGEVVVKNVFTKGEQIYKFEKHFVFPEKTFTFIVTDGVPSLFGLYRAQVNFVDGEGVLRSKNDYTMGYLFPLVFIVFSIMFFVLVKWLLKKRGKNDVKRMDYHQKKRSTHGLQRITDEKKDAK